MYLISKKKRAFDILGCLAAIIIFGPVFLLIAIMIYLEEKKTIFFIQGRLGVDQKTIFVFKFRTMTENKVTKVGAWLRRTGLDELPQFLNVFKGDMSIVGPRPLTQYDVDRLNWSENKFRWQMKPGITGLSQIRSGRGSDLSLQADLEYSKGATLFLDIKIIFYSFLMNIFGKRRIQQKFHM